MADRLYTSLRTDEIISTLRANTKLDKAILARMAFSYSLVNTGKNVARSTNFSGGEMKRSTFVASDEVFLKALINQVHRPEDLDEPLFYSNKSIIKNHIDDGAELLWDLFKKNGEDVSRWYSDVVSSINLSGAKKLKTKDLDIFIGRDILHNNDLIMALNDTAIHANSHLAIMGKPGVGKTQFLLKILADIRVQSDYQTNFIFFDYKGDVVDNEAFIDVSRARTYKLLQNNEYLPISPFILSDYNEQDIQLSAREKAESFASINSKLGVVQKGALTEAIIGGYAARASSDRSFPDFNDVLELALAAYEEEGKRDDSLIEVLRDLANFNLFWSHGSSLPPMEKISNRTMIIDVHKMPVLKELIGYLVIERLYKEMASLPDSPIKDGRRTLRTLLVIDEAHNYLGQKNIFLEKIIREGRSKGIVVFFASQSPSDYQQKFFNFQELLEFSYIFQSEGASAKAIQDILGCSNKTAKDLQSEIAKLEPFQVISRSNIKTDEFMKFTAEPFYKNY
ncbi:DndE family protein [Psychroserpens algicola]|uniref:DndE family protein n=1 Tax=Psychroserpens algicola TaxID=1719034 RepID=UPI001952FF2B|nr:DndE family protein [Psychroserpens algicola]